jgi:hypothetical protein
MAVDGFKGRAIFLPKSLFHADDEGFEPFLQT